MNHIITDQIHSSQINTSSSLLSRTCKTLILVASTVLHTTTTVIILIQEASQWRLQLPPCNGEGHSNRDDLLGGSVVSGKSAIEGECAKGFTPVM